MMKQIRQSKVVWMLGSKPDIIERNHNQIIHYNKRLILPDKTNSYPVSDLRIEVKWQWSMLYLYPLAWIIGYFIRRDVHPWRKVLFIESGNDRVVAKVPYLINWHGIIPKKNSSS